MHTIYLSNSINPDGSVLMEARTPEHGKLLFQVVNSENGPMVMIKPKGIRTVYGLPVSELLSLCYPTIQIIEADKT